MVNVGWSYLMLPSQGEERKRQPVLEVERTTRGGSWFLSGGATEGCSSMVVCGGNRQQESDDVWSDPRWKTTRPVGLKDCLDCYCCGD
jgi:hypothetical protein